MPRSRQERIALPPELKTFVHDEPGLMKLADQPRKRRLNLIYLSGLGSNAAWGGLNTLSRASQHPDITAFGLSQPYSDARALLDPETNAPLRFSISNPPDPRIIAHDNVELLSPSQRTEPLPWFKRAIEVTAGSGW